MINVIHHTFLHKPLELWKGHVFFNQDIGLFGIKLNEIMFCNLLTKNSPF